MTSAPPNYYLLAGKKAINAGIPYQEGQAILSCAAHRLLSRLSPSKPFTVGWYQRPFPWRQRDLRFLLVDIRTQNILYYLKTPDTPRGFDRVLEVRLPEGTDIDTFDDGHRDGASSFSFCEGILSDRFLLRNTYRLDCIEDMEELIGKGLFGDHGGALFSNLAADDYEAWLASNQLDEVRAHFAHYFD